MKIGIDFGTSFSSAAAIVNGELRNIRFGSELQFRTAVFFPNRYVDPSLFSLSPRDDQEVAAAVSSQKSAYGRALTEYNNRLAALVKSEKKSAEDGQPVTERQKAQSRELLVQPRFRADDEVRQAAINGIRRRWIDQQTIAINQESLDIRKANGIFGEDAVDALYSNEEGRIFQSPKSMLGQKLEPRIQDVIVGVVAHVLAHIRQTASQQLGSEITAVTLGRPVEFRGLTGRKNDHLPQSLLERAANEAGFIQVDFLREPVAAAYGYHVASDTAHPALIIDIGGGTTDIAYADIGGTAAQPVIHQVWGTGRGGTDVDAGLSLRAVMPLFGKGLAEHHVLTPLYTSATKVSDLNLQRSFAGFSTQHVAPPYKSRLDNLQKKGATIRLNRDVEHLKIELSTLPTATRALDYIESHLEASANQSDLEQGAERFMMEFRKLLSDVFKALPDIPPVIFLTGGMSRAPYIQACVREIFGLSTIVLGDPSLGVVAGLAAYAALDETHRRDPATVKPKANAKPESAQAIAKALATRQAEGFRLGIERANKLAAKYLKQNLAFAKQYEALTTLFAGTSVGQDLQTLMEKVDQAMEFNIDAGWIPPGGDKFDELEYFTVLVKHDGRGRRFKSLANVPEFLRSEFEDCDESEFRAFLDENREACRCAYDEMPELLNDLDEELVEGDFFDMLHNLPEDAEIDRREAKEARALFDNLHDSWTHCKKTGLSLLHMANQLGDDDYDPGLMEALLFDR